MEKITKMNTPEMPYLPAEIITDILSLLPVKTLIRFKCISKFFLSLISNPQFVKTHLNISSKDPNLIHFRLIFNSVHGRLLRSVSLPSVLSCNPDNALKLDYPTKHPDCSVSVIGSLNGLVCIAINKNNLFIWYPATRASKRLPDTGLENQIKPNTSVYWFGFDESIEDYKVVGIYHLLGNEGLDELVVRVYSLKADSWKIISDFPCGYHWYEPAKYVNGSLHWMMSIDPPRECQWVIVSLDLLSEKYGEIEQPNYDTDFRFLTVSVLRGCLCVLANYRKVRSDLWIMKKYGVRDSWEKMCAIKYAVGLGDLCCPFPYLISSSGEILLEFGNKLVLYNPSDGAFKDTGVLNLNSFVIYGLIYVESLVSPNI